MKKLSFLFLVFWQLALWGQTNWDTAISQIYTPTTGFSAQKVLLDRAPIFADLYNFNNTDFNTCNAQHFKQGLSELKIASNNQYFTNFNSFPNFTSEIETATTIPIGIISTPCAYLNYDEENNSNGNLKLVNGIFTPISSFVSNFIEKELLLVSPLYPAFTSETDSFLFKINPDQWYQYGNPIKKLEANFDDGVFRSLIDNSVIIQNGINVNIPIATNTIKKQEINFRITYENNMVKTTNATILLSKKNNTPSTTKAGACAVSNLIKYRSTIADSQGIKGGLEYKVYYGNNNSTCDVRKPIIIVDGFDPGDKRRIDFQDCQNDARCLEMNPGINQQNYKSIEKLMEYSSTSQLPTSLIDKLNTENYDVILVNFPYYYKVDGNTTSGEICAGADDITRNGKTVASFIQTINTNLQNVGSTEKLVVMGPSMGGLITRYALAYLEKNNINTNTKLWVSMDSPHQGANIPISVQGDIFFLGKKLKNNTAEKQYDELLHSKAAEQMLIDIVDHNGNAVKNQNNVTFLNELKSNGVSNSNGYPVLNGIKKVSITNGSLAGNNNTVPSQVFLDVAASVRIKLLGIRVGRKRIFKIENRFMPPYNQFTNATNPIIFNLGRNPDQNINETIYSLAHSNTGATIFNPIVITNLAYINNFDGSMDAVPGGTNNSANDLKEEVVNSLSTQDASSNQFVSIITTASNLIVNLNTPNPNTVISPQAFIPMHSALDTAGFPNWYQPINKNISCTGQTKFDSFYGENYNMEHISFTKNMVDWLMKNLTIGLQAPHFPILDSSLQGPANICVNTNTTYTFGDICKVPSAATWSVSGNLEIVSQTGLGVTVKGTYNGVGVISAVFQNGQVVEKEIWVGAPVFKDFNFINNTGVSYCLAPTDQLKIDLPTDKVVANFAGMTSLDIFNNNNWEWQRSNNLIIINSSTDKNTRTICPMGPGFSSFKVRAKNACGWSEWYEIPEFEITALPPGIFMKQSANTFTVFPNPSNDMVYIGLKDTTKKPEKETVITGELYDILGFSKTKVNIVNNKASFSVKGLNKGIYILKIYINNQVESHQISVE
ncbi:esterase/lipase family protein [Amniculibacterium sp. G2-70]|uniref:esterase/lipase family protein n=1 Tax=Amniculibacterium sp. G2-70 TaxID=2767188 RepID=UPI0016540079|nr:T9SS type A sorting domain-containing protein [Amniculibacterium sp. G2-70]